MKNNFYIYAYLDPRKPGKYCYDDVCFLFEPFYIGKGMNFRLNVHLNEAKKGNIYYNQYKYNKIIKIISETNRDPIITKCATDLTEKDAYDLERKIIDNIGLNNLTNLCEGGIGGSCQDEQVRYNQGSAMRGKKHSEEWKNNYMRGEKNSFYGKTHTDETKRKISEASKGKKRAPFTKEHIENMRKSHLGKKSSPEAIEKMRKSLTGRKLSEEHKQKLQPYKCGERSPTAKRWKIISPENETFFIKGTLVSFCEERNLSWSMVFYRLKKNLPMPFTQGINKNWSFFRLE